jgi:hypothetical protein
VGSFLSFQLPDLINQVVKLALYRVETLIPRLLVGVKYSTSGVCGHEKFARASLLRAPGGHELHRAGFGHHGVVMEGNVTTPTQH